MTFDAFTISLIVLVAVGLLALRFVWKNVRRGIIAVIVLIILIWLMRTFMPGGWSRLIDTILR